MLLLAGAGSPPLDYYAVMQLELLLNVPQRGKIYIPHRVFLAVCVALHLGQFEYE